MDETLDKPHRSNLRLNRRMYAPGCFFVTKALEPRKKIVSAGMAEIISSTWTFYAEKQEIYLAAFAVMLDHWHVLFATGPQTMLPARLQAADRWIGGHTNRELADSNCHWEDGYHDTRIRSSKQFRHVRRYIENNPVAAGLAQCAEEWLWSSANPRYRPFITNLWPWRFEQDPM